MNIPESHNKFQEKVPMLRGQVGNTNHFLPTHSHFITLGKRKNAWQMIVFCILTKYKLSFSNKAKWKYVQILARLRRNLQKFYRRSILKFCWTKKYYNRKNLSFFGTKPKTQKLKHFSFNPQKWKFLYHNQKIWSNIYPFPTPSNFF